MRSLRLAWIVFCTDLRLELRRREALGAVFYFSLLTALILSFALQGEGLPWPRLLPPLLLTAVLFSATLFLNRLFEAEREGGALAPLRSGAYPRAALFLGKWAGQWLALSAIATWQLLGFAFFLDLQLGGAALGRILFVLSAAIAGLAAGGLLFSTMMARARFRDLLLPLLLFPVHLPLLFAAMRLLRAALEGASLRAGPWLSLLLGFDLIAMGLALALFETVFEGERD